MPNEWIPSGGVATTKHAGTNSAVPTLSNCDHTYTHTQYFREKKNLIKPQAQACRSSEVINRTGKNPNDSYAFVFLQLNKKDKKKSQLNRFLFFFKPQLATMAAAISWAQSS